MKNYIKIFLLIFCICSVEALYAKNFEGYITYKVDYTENPDISFEQEQVIPKSITIYIKEDKIRVNTEAAIIVGTIIDNKKNKATSLMSVLGMKVAFDIPKNEIDKNTNQEYEVFEIKGEKRNILGYPCKKAHIKSKNSEFDLYYTPNIQIENAFTKGLSYLKELKGLPMEFNQKINGVDIHFVCKKIQETEVAPSLFEIPSDYQKIDPSDLKGLMNF